MSAPHGEIITSHERLREVIAPPSPFVADKVIDHVDELCSRFIAASPFVVIATTGRDGAVDVSPKGDPPGFVQVLDHRTLAVPERPGNHLANSMCNLVEDDRVGLLFLVPGKGETLRISGRARIVRDRELCGRLAHAGHPPEVAMVVTVQRAFLHCAKCMIRSHLWQPDQWPALDDLPTLGEAMKKHGQLTQDLREVEAVIADDAATRLY